MEFHLFCLWSSSNYSSSHLEPGGRVDVCFLTHIYAENFTKYFTETVSKIMLC